MDTSFGTGGQAIITDFNGGNNATSNADAVQSDGKTIVVGSSTNGNFVVSRFNIDGTLDTSFGPDQTGIVVTDMGSADSSRGAFAVAIQPDGKILVAGGVASGSSSNKGAVARYLSNGSLDTTFSGDGKAFVDFGLFTDNGEFRSIALQSDGKIVLGGSVFSGILSGSLDFALARLNASGTQDGSFGDGGTAVIDIGDDDDGRSITIDYSGTPNTNPHFGDIVAVGQSDQKLAIVRVKPNGDLDKSFDSDGKLTKTFPKEGFAEATGVAIESDGNIVVSGDVGQSSASNLDFLIARYLPNGTLDTTFGTLGGAGPGYTISDFGGNDAAWCMIQSYDGGFLVAGSDAIAKYTDNGLLDGTFGDNGFVQTIGEVLGMALGPGRRFVTTGGDHFATERYLDAGADLVYAASLDPNAAEDGQNPASFFVYRSERLPDPTTVYFTISGTANSPMYPRLHPDYSLDGMTVGLDGLSPNYVVIPADQTYAVVTLTPFDDANVEGAETAVFTILPESDYEVGTPSSVTLTIKDNDGGSISGNVFNDVNSSGDKDFTEPGLGAWTVYADLNNNKKLDSGEPSTTTDAGGDYDLRGLLPGTYKIRQVVPSGWRQTAPAGNDAIGETIARGQDVTGADFGDTQQIQISGEVFQDTDGDGALDTNETGYEGATVYIDANGNNKFDSGELSVLSGPDGSYAIYPSAAGTYKIRVVAPAGFSQTLPANNGNYSAAVTSSQIVTGKNFGIKPVTAAAVVTGITGSVFNDLNVNGTRDVGKHTDPDDVGWLVWLDTNNNGVLDAGEPSHKTDGGGNFIFTKLKTGVVYHLRSELQSGWRRTTAAVFNITLKRNQVVTEKFGVTQKAAVSGNLFNDLNGNKTQQTGEPGLSGWKVFIDTNDNGKLDAGEVFTTTDIGGNWVIDDLAAGVYQVRAVLLKGWTLTTPVGGDFSISLSNGQHVAHKAFGVKKPA